MSASYLYSTILPRPCPLSSTDLFDHVYDLCLLSCCHVWFVCRHVMFRIFLFVFAFATASLFFAWMVSVHRTSL